MSEDKWIDSAIMASTLTGNTAENPVGEPEANPYDSLSVPTWFTRIKDRYFLVDCYHDQVIYSDTPDAPLSDWKVMTHEMDRGHTVASDGYVYLVDDTENDRIMIFEEADGKDLREDNSSDPQGAGEGVDGGFVFTQEFTQIKTRPHYIIYDEETKTFYAWASTGGRMYLFKRDERDNRVYLTQIKEIPSLDGIYVRSFTLLDDEILFPGANGEILVADRESFEIRERYTVPPSIGGMIQLTLIDGWYYLTVSTDITGFQEYATIVRSKSLKELSEGQYEDVYDSFIGGGTPYAVTEVDGYYYLTEHRLPGHSLWRFTVEDGVISSTAVY